MLEITALIAQTHNSYNRHNLNTKVLQTSPTDPALGSVPINSREYPITMEGDSKMVINKCV